MLGCFSFSCECFMLIGGTAVWWLKTANGSKVLGFHLVSTCEAAAKSCDLFLTNKTLTLIIIGFDHDSQDLYYM